MCESQMPDRCRLSSVSRRQAVRTILGAACSAGMAASTHAMSRSDPSTTGPPDPAFAPFDDLITAFMREQKIPGASLAVTRHGKLAYARGYGWEDVDRQAPYLPTNLFRIASLSKAFTSAAVLVLVQQGKLDLDAAAFPLLALEPHLEPGATVDPRLKTVTVRQLLHHTGGFDRAISFDPMFIPRRIAAALDVESPPGPREIIRYMLGQPLDFEPGSRYAYSNYGYCVLGRIIEKVSRSEYGAFVQEHILRPVGISGMRLGRSLIRDRAPGEVRYYDGENRRTRSIFSSDADAAVPVQYGGWCIESMDSHGGWLASAVDLARFGAALDSETCPFLTAATRPLLYERPAPPVSIEEGRPAAAFYGMGWMVRPTAEGRANYWHSGKLDGSSSLFVRRHDGLSWVLNFNYESVEGDSLASRLDGPLHGAADAVRVWPTHDLFDAM